jgi:hypothetical protein
MWLIAFIVITVVGGVALPGELGGYWVMICWAVAIVALLRRRYVKAQIERKLGIDYSPSHIPAAVIPLAYFFRQIEPALSYLLLKRDLRRNERIRAFLKLADDLRMRKQSVNRALPPGSGRQGVSGEF